MSTCQTYYSVLSLYGRFKLSEYTRWTHGTHGEESIGIWCDYLFSTMAMFHASHSLNQHEFSRVRFYTLPQPIRHQYTHHGQQWSPEQLTCSIQSRLSDTAKWSVLEDIYLSESILFLTLTSIIAAFKIRVTWGEFNVRFTFVQRLYSDRIDSSAMPSKARFVSQYARASDLIRPAVSVDLRNITDTVHPMVVLSYTSISMNLCSSCF